MNRTLLLAPLVFIILTSASSCFQDDRCNEVAFNSWPAYISYQQAEADYFWNDTPENCQRLRLAAGVFLSEMSDLGECFEDSTSPELNQDRTSAESYIDQLQC